MPLQLFGVGMPFNINVDRRISAVKAVPDAPVVPLTMPEKIGNISVWFDASKGITSDANNKVSVWADQSGNGNNAVQLAASNQPSVGVDSTGTYISASSMQPLQFNPISMVDSTVMAVFIHQAPIGSGWVSGVLGDADFKLMPAFFNADGTMWGFNVHIGNMAINHAFSPANPVPKLAVATEYVTLTGLGSSLNYRSSTHNQTYSFPSTPTGGTTFMADRITTNIGYTTVPVRIYEVVIFKGQLSTQQKADMHTYFANKYNLGF